MLEWLVGWSHLGAWLLAFGGGLAPCRARLPGKGGPSLADILLLWLDLGSSELYVGSSNLLVP